MKSLIALTLMTLMPMFGFAQSERGVALLVLILKPSGEPVNTAQIPVRARILSPNDCVLVDEMHASVDIEAGYMRLAVGTGTRQAGDHGLTVAQALSASQVRTGLDSVSGASGTCNYTPQAQDVRKLHIDFQIGADPIAADFTIRSSGYAVVADEANSLSGKSADSFLQANNTKQVTQSKLEEFFNTITSQAGKLIKFDGTNFVAVDPATLGGSGGSGSTDWSQITNKPSTFTPSAHTHPVSDIIGLGSLATKSSVSDADISGLSYSKLTDVPATFAPSAHSHYYSDLQNKAGAFLNYKPDNTACSDQQVLKYETSSGHWVCADDAQGSGGGAATIVSATAPLSVSGTTSAPVISIQAASASQAGYISSSDYQSFSAKLSSTLADGKILVGNASNQAAPVAVSGDATINNAGVVALKSVGAAGSYNKVTTDAQGRVISGSLGVNLSDLKSSIAGSLFPTNCGANQVMTYASPSDSYICSNIAGLNASVIIAGVLSESFGGTGLSALGVTGKSLLQSADQASARSTLGLGSAAILDVGTAANNVVQLDASGKLPAVDGSQLTNLPASSVPMATTSVAGLVSTDTQTLGGAKTFNDSVTVNSNLSAKVYTSPSVTDSTGVLDMSSGSTFITSFACSTSTPITLNNLVDGASYNVIATDAGTGQCVFAATGLTFKFQPANAARTASTHSVYSMLRAGSVVYVFWTTGF